MQVKAFAFVSLLVLILFTYEATLGRGVAEAQSCASPPSGLVSWWPGDGNPADIAGSNPGTLQGDATFGIGRVDQAFNLDGVNAFISMGDVLDVGMGDLTVDAWVKLVGPVSLTNAMIVDKGVTILENANRPGYLLYIFADGTLRFGVSDTNTPTFENVQTPYPTDGQYHHVAGVLDRTNSQIRLYLDGTLSTTTNFATLGSLETAIPLSIGAIDRGAFGPDAGFFPGLIDEVEIFNSALSDAEIKAIFDAGSAGKCKAGATPIPSLTQWALVALAVSLVGLTYRRRLATRV